jgi:hypothetical protein
MNTSSRRIAFRALCAALLLGTSFFGAGESSARADTPTPQFQGYYCPYEGASLAFEWTRQMPGNGWLGKTYGFTQDDVQAYNALPLGSNGSLNWGFQAQNGEYVCRMYVTSDKRRLDFVNCRPYGAWPVSSCWAF